MTSPMRSSRQTFIGHAVRSSIVIQRVKQALAGSAICAPVIALARGLRRTGARIEAGLQEPRPDDERSPGDGGVETLINGSHVMTVAAWLIATLDAALTESFSVRLLGPVLQADLATRIRVGGYTVLFAVLTHTLLLAALGGSVTAIGWSLRIGVAIAALVAVGRSNALAVAARDRPFG